ncbi:hypothetical protein K8W59_18190 [Nocardioides rotundus]|uniref:hypothetical protein n=1 Tax=Nocardioides rotundus TaxID=1774216 RepID=UPI001CBB15BE|nr:hypothetical protein [Nocardioides rotundus]UAL29646.1 hypothetical protein K8W59_18190 [Nocardioides rotundus]
MARRSNLGGCLFMLVIFGLLCGAFWLLVMNRSDLSRYTLEVPVENLRQVNIDGSLDLARYTYRVDGQAYRGSETMDPDVFPDIDITCVDPDNLNDSRLPDPGTTCAEFSGE